MNQISIPPGAVKFRLVIIIILVLTFMVILLGYARDISIVTEKASIRQTSNIINSTLAVVFAEHVVKGEMNRLNEIGGSNPFVFLDKYNLLPATYQGELGTEGLGDLVSGWYYDEENGQAIYKPYHDEQIYYFAIELEFRDVNGSGFFEEKTDSFNRLSFKQLPQQ